MREVSFSCTVRSWAVQGVQNTTKDGALSAAVSAAPDLRITQPLIGTERLLSMLTTVESLVCAW